MGLVVAVVGATGVVGREMLRILESRRFPADRVLALASPKSKGTKIPFRGGELEVEAANADAFRGVKIALFSAGASLSRELAPAAAAHGATVIDNSSAWRMDPDVPLIVSEVNLSAALRRPKGIIANPNCCAMPLTVALKPLHDAATVRHVVVSTYQAASGKGHRAVEELHAQTRAIANGEKPLSEIFPGQLAHNVLMDWKPGNEDYSEEELKIVEETKKILEAPSMAISPTTVRVPVVTAHGEAVHVQFGRPMFAKEAKALLRSAPGVELLDEPYAPGRHPQPVQCAGTDDVFVGRVRDDLTIQGAINMWIVADNLRKGAALNAVQIAEGILRLG